MKNLTSQQIQLLKTHYPTATAKEMKKLFPEFTNYQLGRIANKLGVRKKNPHNFARRFWTEDKVKEFRKLYPNTSNVELAKHFGVSLSSIKNAATSFNARKSQEYMSIPENNGHYPKGNIPHNKGKKGIRVKGCEKTWFKKGNIPHNHRPIGSRRKDNKDGYWSEKVGEPKEWKLVHRMVWENHNGPIPEGHDVQFIDGNRDNCDDINNLKLVSFVESITQCRNSDGFIGNCIERDPEKRKEVLKHYPDLLDVKRKQLELLKEISE